MVGEEYHKSDIWVTFKHGRDCLLLGRIIYGITDNKNYLGKWNKHKFKMIRSFAIEDGIKLAVTSVEMLLLKQEK